MQKRISLLGSTGSIGTQALDVARKHSFSVVALAGGRNIELLEAQAREFKPQLVAVADEKAGREIQIALKDTNTKVVFGENAAVEAAAIECDAVLNSIVGIAGLKPTLAAIESGNEIALANKETLVAAGDIVIKNAADKGVRILPVDSEHSAIFQSLQGVPKNSLKKIILTASGGPFFGKTREELENITPQMALKHPNWDMGAKITIDSSTLMNKGLEVIEAVKLFGVDVDDIEVVVHRESIIHSAVMLNDGAVIAQLGVPDMRLPIQYALTYPNRYECPGDELNLFELGKMTFYKPDYDTFTCLSTCISAVKDGGLKPAAANGANEEAVAKFLKGNIKYLQIGELVAEATQNQASVENYSIEDVFAADKMAREFINKKIGS